MNIIAGKHRGRRILSDNKIEYRPTTGRVREALFNIIYSRRDDVSQLTFLDVCCGSGSCGLEALSRGFSHVGFIDISRNNIDNVKKNIEILKETNSCTLFNYDIKKLPVNKNAIKYNIVFIDPPYNFESVFIIRDILQNNGWLQDDTMVFIETTTSNNLIRDMKEVIKEIKTYGRTSLLIL